MRILVTGAGSNIGKGIVARLREAGHSLVLSDLVPLPDLPQFADVPFVQCDIQAGFGLEGAAQGCDLLLHLPAWHGIHSRVKTEADFWRLNVDGTFWALQAARSAGISRLVFLSSQSWHDHYGKYGFTKQVGEELCEYHRRNHGLRYVAIRPHDFTPWGDDYLNRYGARLLYGGVDREDVLGYVEAAVEHLGPELPGGADPEGLVVDAVRPNVYSEEQVREWEDDPLAACDRVFPGSGDLVKRYGIDVRRRPSVVAGGEEGAGAAIGYTPTRHFGTFLEELRALDAAGGPDAVRALTCPY
ncbi:NAD(P)-dependent oxidoreductase [Actinopolymorpha sp. NPDC004070]|uniref:NAD-dependent epimerase/dehydratase family protein n=1 Tax=Actinopolymorpha sp. NPDC004070 TaxID=3154548 RepID=UPI0033B23454